MIRTRLTDLLDLQYPVISAPMARSSGGELASAVSIAGGLGTFGGAHPPSNPIGPDYIREQISLIRERTEQPFGVGFITHLIEHYPQNFELVIDENVPVVLLSFADPRPWLRKIKAKGATAICQVQTLDAARIAVEEGADVLAIQGNEAGGHTGAVNLLPFLTQALEAFPDKPIVAAGGIASGRGLAAVLAAGADGAWIGTAFQAVIEATEVSSTVRDFILQSDGQDTVRNTVFDILGYHAFQNPRWPEGIAMRTRRNKFLDAWHGNEEELLDNIDELAEIYQKEAEADNPDVTPYLYGESAAFVQRVQTAEEFMNTICREAERHLKNGAKKISDSTRSE